VNRRRAIAALLPLAVAGCGGPKTTAPTKPSATPAPSSTPNLGVRSADAASIEPWKFGAVPGAVLRTEHYRIYTTVGDGVMRDRVVVFVEEALNHYRSALAPLPAPPIKLDVYLMASRTQWVSVTRALMAEQAEMLVKIPRGGYAARGIGVYFDIGLYDTLAIAAHEGWHQYTQRAFAEGLPVWLEEGIATYMEGHRWNGAEPQFVPWANLQRFDQLRKAAASHQLQPLESLLEARPQDYLDQTGETVLTYYAQLWALVHFLNEGAGGRYSKSLQEAVLDAAGGGLARRLVLRAGDQDARHAMLRRTGPAVFLAYFNTDLAAASREYDEFMRRLVETGSRGPITRGISPMSGR
jgi:hypothetical protein